MSRLFRNSFLKGLLVEEKPRLLLNRQIHQFWLLSTLVLFTLILLGLWLSYSSLGFTLQTKGIVLPLGGVRDIHSQATGQIVRLDHRSGDQIFAGKVLARLQDLEKAQNYYEQREIYQLTAKKNNVAHQKLEREVQGKKQQFTEQIAQYAIKLDFLKMLEKQLDSALKTFSIKGKKSLNAQQKTINTLKKQYQSYMDKLAKLKAKGYATDTNLLDRLSGFESLLNSQSEIERQGYQSSIDHNFSLKELGRIRDDIASTTLEKLQAQQELHLLIKQQEIDHIELALQERKARKDLVSAERDWWRNTLLIAPYDGRLLSVIPGIGQQIQAKDAFGIMELQMQNKKQLLSLSPRTHQGKIILTLNGKQLSFELRNNTLDAFYLSIAKRVQTELVDTDFDYAIEESGLILVAASNALGENLLDSLQIEQNQLTDSANIPVFAAIANLGDNWKAEAQVNISVVPVNQAKLIAQGTKLNLIASHQSRWLDDSAFGQVMQVSDYPMTSLEIENLVGSKELAKKITSNQQGHIVISRVETGKFATATLTENSFTLGERSPLSIFIPFIEQQFSKKEGMK